MLPGLEPMISMLKRSLEDKNITNEEKAKMEKSIKAIESINEASSKGELNEIITSLMNDLMPKKEGET